MTLVTLPVGRNDFSNSVENNRHFVKFTLCFFLLCVHGVCISCVLYYQLHFRKIVFTAAIFFYCGACYVLFIPRMFGLQTCFYWPFLSVIRHLLALAVSINSVTAYPPFDSFLPLRFLFCAKEAFLA